MKKVFYLTFEALPYMKTGGLADVSAILPFSFSDDIKVKIFLPFSNKINKKNFSFKEIDSFVVDFNEHKEEVKLYQDATKDIYFLSNETYLDCKDLYTKSAKEITDYFNYFNDIYSRSEYEPNNIFSIDIDNITDTDRKRKFKAIISHLNRDDTSRNQIV